MFICPKTLQADIDFVAEVEKHCKGIDFDKLEVDGDERQKRREDYEPNLSISYADLVLIINDGEYGKMATPKFVVLAILCVLCFLFSFVLFFVILCSFCVCTKVKGNSKEKCYFITTVVFIVCFLLFLILMLVYAGKTEDNIQKIQCVSAKFPNDILNGKKEGEVQFLGFTPLIDMLTQFKTNLDIFKDLESEFDTVTNLNIPGVTQTALDSINPVETDFTNKSSADGNGSSAISLAIQKFPETMEIVKKEFKIYNDIGTQFNDASQSSKQFKDAAMIEDAKLKLDEAIKSIEDVKKSLKDIAEDFFYYIDIFSDSTNKVYVSDLVIALINLALFIFVVIILFCQSHKKKCLWCSWIIKIILVILALLAIALSIMSIALLVMSIGFGSSCNMFEEILTTKDFNSILIDLKLETGDNNEIGNILNGCIAEEGKGSLEDLVGNIEFGDLNTILDGLSDFDKLKIRLTSSPENSPSIDEITKQYQEFNDGIQVNQEKAIENQIIINDDIDCDDQFMTFNSKNCKEDFTCKVVSSLDSYSAPTCADSSSNTIFTNLKTYDTGNRELMTDLITRLKGEDPNTPNSQYKNVFNTISQAFASYDIIKSKLKDVLATVQEFTEGFAKVANCRIVRTELLLFEDAICFGFNKNLFRFFLFTLLFTIFLTLLIFSVCCTMRHSNNDKDDDELKVNDFEKMPGNEPFYQ